jgi:hypothetical protein
MVQRRDGFRFVVEAPSKFIAITGRKPISEIGAYQFDGDDPTRSDMPRPKNDPHSTDPDLLKQLVSRDLGNEGRLLPLGENLANGLGVR